MGNCEQFFITKERGKKGLTGKEFSTIIGERCANKFSRQVDKRETTHTFILCFSKKHTKLNSLRTDTVLNPSSQTQLVGVLNITVKQH